MTQDATYIAVRDFTDTWGLVITMVTFVVLVLWPFRPGGRKDADQAANMIFEEAEDGQH